MLRPLNREEIIPIPKKLRYPPVTHGGFTEAGLATARGSRGIWAKALVLDGVGASADASVQHQTQRTVTCDAVITTYFDPDSAYVAQSLAVRGVNEHFYRLGLRGRRLPHHGAQSGQKAALRLDRVRTARGQRRSGRRGA